MGDMMMSKVFKRLSQMRAFQHTSNRDHTINIFEYMSIDRGGYAKYPPPASYNPVKHWFAPTWYIFMLYLVRIDSFLYQQKLTFRYFID